MANFRFARGEPLPQRFVEHVLGDASLAAIAERWGITEASAGYWRRKVKAGQRVVGAAQARSEVTSAS